MALFQEVSELHYGQIIDLLSKVSKNILPDHIDKIINITFNDSILEFSELIPDSELLKMMTTSDLDEKVIKCCSVKLLEFLKSSNEQKQLFALELIFELSNKIEIMDEHINLIFNLLGNDNDINEAVGATLRKICTKLRPEHINKLFGHFENCNIDIVRSDVFTGLAEMDELGEHYIERILQIEVLNRWRTLGLPIMPPVPVSFHTSLHIQPG